MFMRSAALILALVAGQASASDAIIPDFDVKAGSKLGKRLLSKARALNEERDVTFVANYSIKYRGCSSLIQIASLGLLFSFIGLVLGVVAVSQSGLRHILSSHAKVEVALFLKPTSEGSARFYATQSLASPWWRQQEIAATPIIHWDVAHWDVIGSCGCDAHLYYFGAFSGHAYQSAALLIWDIEVTKVRN